MRQVSGKDAGRLMALPSNQDNEQLKLNLSATIEVGSNGDNAKTSPVKIVANSGEPTNYPQVGKIVFDFDTMNHKAKMPLDWEHGQSIGYLNHINATNGVLETSGAIVPGDGAKADD